MTFRSALIEARSEAHAAARRAEEENTPEAWAAWRKADDNLRGWEEAYDPS